MHLSRSLFRPYALLLPALLWLLATACRQQGRRPDVGFYYWQTRMSLGDTEQNVMRDLHTKFLYVRLFDVDTGRDAAGQLQAVPVAMLRTAAALPDSVEVVPVVYLTRQAVLHMGSADTLARRLEQLVQELVSLHGWTYREIQWDYDWTPSTRDAYFSLLRTLHARPSFAGKRFSATIRLHQVKHRSKTGIPPVDKGLLMCYNMGNLKQYGERNSILDEGLCRDYLSALPDYPLPLDVALPVFGWGLQFRQKQFHAILNGVADADLQDTTSFSSTGAHVYRVRRATRVKGFAVQSGDEIRVEWADAATLRSVARYVGHRNPNDSARLLFFHLHSNLLQHYRPHDLQDILDAY